MQANLAEIQAAAARRAQSRTALVVEEVEWDVNTRSAEARLAPFVYRSAAGPSFEIAQRKEPANEPGAPHSGTGTALWTAAVGLAKYLEWRYPPGGANGGLMGKRCLELGCGTGLVSLVAASLGAAVVATDIPEIVHGHTKPNFDANLTALARRGEALHGEVSVRELVWGDTPLQAFGTDWDLIVASDVIYRAAHVPLLLRTLQGLLGSRGEGRAVRIALVAFDKRGREGVETFLRMAAAPSSGLVLREASAAEMPPGNRFAHFGCVELTAAEGDLVSTGGDLD